MRLRFHKLRWKNFLSTGNIFTEVRLDSAHSTGIFGTNGAGKSTMIDAFMYCLFNKPFRKFNIPDLLNSITNKDMLVECEFYVNDKQYMVRRGFKPKVFEIYQEGVLLNQDADARDYQSFLEAQILHTNFKTMTQTSVIGKASYVPFMELPAGQKREIIEDLLDLQIFSTMNVLLKQRSADNTALLSNANNDSVTLRQQLELLREMEAKLSQNNLQAIAAKEKELAGLLENLERVDGELIGIKAEIDALPPDNRSVFQEKRDKILSLRSKLNQNSHTHQSAIDFFENNDNCPTCKQRIETEFRDQTLGEHREKLNEITSALTELTKKMVAVEKSLADCSVYEKQRVDLTIKFRERDTTWKSISKTIVNVQAEIEQLKLAVATQHDDRIQEHEAKLEDLSRQISELTEKRDLYNMAGTILKDGGIKSRIIRQYIPVINSLINKYLASMDFFVNFELDEEFNETIKSRHRDKFKYHSFSEGEKVRINLAILFAWRAVAKLRSSSNVNLLIIDEVMDGSLDHSGTEDFLKLVKSLPEDTNTFVVSHKTDQVEGRFDRAIKFVKTKNFSRIVEE